MGSLSQPKSPLPTPWRPTPLIPSLPLTRTAKANIYLKLENLQPSGSFKSRGIGNLILHHAAKHLHTPTTSNSQDAASRKPLHFYSSSGGNAGLAAVTAARTLSHACTVVVPESTEEAMIAKLLAAGAHDVLVHGASWFEADSYMRDVVMKSAKERGEEVVYVPPFDDPLIWEGASSIVQEVARQIPDGEAPEAIVCSVGGGGLFVGVMLGLEMVGWGDGRTRVIAVETAGAESLNDSLRAERVVTRKEVSSVAKSLGAARVAERAFEFAQQENVKSVVVTDAEACEACWRFVDDERVLVEPACGASVALAYDSERLREVLPGLSRDAKVVVVVCGGSRVSVGDLLEWREKFGSEWKMGRTGKAEVPSDFTTK